MTTLGLLGLWRVFKRDSSLGMRFAIVLFFFPLTYYFSHPETYYFRPVDPLIVVLAAVTVAGGSKTSELTESSKGLTTGNTGETHADPVRNSV